MHLPGTGFVLTIVMVLGILTWGCATATSQEPELPGSEKADGRLFNYIQPYGSPPQTCYYDAVATLQKGAVASIKRAADSAGDKVRVGVTLTGLDPKTADLETTIPMPFYIDQDGKLRPGYAECDVEAAP